MSFKVLILFILALLVASCANLSELEQASLDEIDKLNKEFSENTNNALYHIKLGTEYEKLGRAQSSRFYLMRAISEFDKALALQPDNTKLMIAVYNLQYIGVIDRFVELNDLLNTYNSIDSTIRQVVNPPHLAMFIREQIKATYGGTSEQMLEQTIKQAFSESPLNPIVSYHFSNLLLNKKQEILSVDVLKRSLIENPDNNLLKMQLGFAYEAYANRDYCPYAHPNELKKSLNLLQGAAKNMPDNPYLLYKLSEMYERFNVAILMVDSAKKVVSIDPGIESQMLLAEALSNVGEYRKASEIYQELVRSGYTEVYLEKALTEAENGEIQSAYFSFEKYLDHHNQLDVYSALLYLVLEGLAGKKETPRTEIERYIDLSQLNKWQKSLIDYWYDELSQEALSAQAIDLCKKTESDFLFGVKKIKSGENTSAKKYLEQITDRNLYSFVEYRIAPHLISMIQN